MLVKVQVEHDGVVTTVLTNCAKHPNTLAKYYGAITASSRHNGVITKCG